MIDNIKRIVNGIVKNGYQREGTVTKVDHPFYDAKEDYTSYSRKRIRVMNDTIFFNIDDRVSIFIPYDDPSSAQIIGSGTDIPGESAEVVIRDSDYEPPVPPEPPAPPEPHKYFYCCDNDGIYYFRDNTILRSSGAIVGTKYFMTLHDNKLYIQNNDTIVITDLNFNVLQTISSIGGYDLNSPQGITFYDGYIYVSDRGNNAVLKCNSSWSLIWRRTLPSPRLYSPEDSVIYNNSLYVCCDDYGKALGINLSNGDETGNNIGNDWSPEGIAVDSAGNFYITFQAHLSLPGYIKKFNSSGIELASYSTGTTATNMVFLSSDETLLYVCADTQIVIHNTSDLSVNSTIDHSFYYVAGIYVL